MKSGSRSTLARAALAVAVSMAITACQGGGGGGAPAALPATDVSSGLQPVANGFSFPNFPSNAYPITFGDKDLVAMFGSGESVCVGAVADPCTLTAEAAAFARMVNQARATGHCEGLVTVALSRFDAKSQPNTVALPDRGETLDAIMRAFATQFIPEVQKEVGYWAKKSLKDKVAALAQTFAAGSLTYTLGVYVKEGGHALLPYAIKWPSADVARIMVYDSNWPAKERWVDVDLKAKKWTFSFSGSDPANDPNAWTGGSGDMDLTGIDKRVGSCPFCGDGTTVQKNTLLVRTDNLDWSVDVNNKKVSPADPNAAADDGVTVKPVKGTGDRNAYDYMVQIPVSPAGNGATSGKVAGVKFSGAATMFAMTPSGIAQVQTPAGSSAPVEIGSNSIKSSDPNVNLTLAAGNLVASASGGQTSLEVNGDALAVKVQTPSGQVIEQQVTPDAPAAKVTVDSATGAATVLSQTSTGSVVKRDVASDGTEKTSTVNDMSLNLSSPVYVPPKGLESKQVDVLPQLKDRNLANADYKAEVGKAAESVVIAQKPVVGSMVIFDRTFGDPPFTVAPPESTSPGAFTFTSSNPDVATVTPAGKVTIKGSGTVFINAIQEGTAAFLSSTTTATLRISKAKSILSTAPAVAKNFGDDPFTMPTLTSTNPADIVWESSDTRVVKVGATTGRVTIVGPGTATLIASQAANDRYEAGERRVQVTVAKRPASYPAQAAISKTFGEADFLIVPPTAASTVQWSFSSSDTGVADVDATSGLVSLKSAGSATITLSHAATDTDTAGSVTVTLTVARRATSYPAQAAVSKTFGDATFTVATPAAASTVRWSFSSSDTGVADVNATSGLVSLKSAGTATITMSHPATATDSAGSATVSVTVAKRPNNLTLPTTATMLAKTVGDPDFTFAAPTTVSSGAVTYSSGNTSVISINATSGIATVVGAGSAVITVRQAATATDLEGSATATVTVVEPPKLAQASITVTTATSVQWVQTTLNATGGSGTGALSWNLVAAGTAGCTMHDGYVIAQSAGSCTVTVTKAGDSTYQSVTSPEATITFGALASGVNMTGYEYLSNDFVTGGVPDMSLERQPYGSTGTTPIVVNDIYGVWFYAGPLGLWDYFILRYDGYIVAPTDSNVRFKVGWDDGVDLLLDGTSIARNWAISCCSVAISDPIAMKAGVARPFRMWFFDNQYNAAVGLWWSFDNGVTWELVPATALYRTP